ncbi:MAG TPA: hypothetical protein H9881_07460 [Candidatus Stackebrandtia excrementipullorum]|nr:hypothetical protein [Candidatus Stackebrandtia excrementipullorum]
MNLDRSRLNEIAGLSDPLGVLSIYVTAEPGEEAETPAWQVRTRNALEDLRRRAHDSGDREFDQAVRGRLDTLGVDLEWALAPSTSGLGRALFVPLSNGEVHRVSVQASLGDLVRCADRAYVRPLLAAWSAGSPVGVAVATGDGIRIMHVAFGIAEDIAHLKYVDPSGEWTELKGPANSQPGLAQQTAPQHDLFEARRAQDLKRYLASGHETLRRHAEEEGWEFLVVAGEPQLREAVVEHLGYGFQPTIVTGDSVVGMTHPPAAKVAELIEPDLERARRDRDRDLVRRLDETKKSTRGIDQTLAAVQEGRAEIVLMDAQADWRGSRDDNGRYVAEEVVPPGSNGNGLVAEPELGERIVELAIDHSTDVAVLDEDVAAELSEADGLAAILRW